MVRMLVTRPAADAGETIARLQAIGIEGVASPLLDCVPLHANLPAPASVSALAVTSANALRMLAARDALRPYLGHPLFAVGERTAAIAQALGFADVVESGGTLAHLVADLVSAGLDGPVLYPAARHQSGDLGAELAPRGIVVETVRVYEMRAATALPDAIAADLVAQRFAAALFYSRRSAETFATLAAPLPAPALRTNLGVLCLSAQVAAPLLAAHFVRANLAEQPSEEAMMTLALAFARDQNAS